MNQRPHTLCPSPDHSRHHVDTCQSRCHRYRNLSSGRAGMNRHRRKCCRCQYRSQGPCRRNQRRHKQCPSPYHSRHLGGICRSKCHRCLSLAPDRADKDQHYRRYYHYPRHSLRPCHRNRCLHKPYPSPCHYQRLGDTCRSRCHRYRNLARDQADMNRHYRKYCRYQCRCLDLEHMSQHHRTRCRSPDHSRHREDTCRSKYHHYLNLVPDRAGTGPRYHKFCRHRYRSLYPCHRNRCHHKPYPSPYHYQRLEDTCRSRCHRYRNLSRDQVGMNRHRHIFYHCRYHYLRHKDSHRRCRKCRRYRHHLAGPDNCARIYYSNRAHFCYRTGICLCQHTFCRRQHRFQRRTDRYQHFRICCPNQRHSWHRRRRCLCLNTDYLSQRRFQHHMRIRLKECRFCPNLRHFPYLGDTNLL